MQRLGALGRRAHGDGQAQRRRPQRGLDGPHLLGHTFGGNHQEPLRLARAKHVTHGGQGDRGLAGANWRQDHRPVALVQEIRCGVLIWPKTISHQRPLYTRHTGSSAPTAPCPPQKFFAFQTNGRWQS